MSRCLICDAEIVWARHITTHRPAPINVLDPADPDQRLGSVLVIDAPDEMARLGAMPTYLIDETPGDEPNRTTLHQGRPGWDHR